MKACCKRRKVLFLFFFAFCSLFIFACSGGGGGAGADAQPSLSYNGLTEKMRIDESNASEVTTGAVEDGVRGNVFSSMSLLEEVRTNDERRTFSAFYLAEMVEEAVLVLTAEALSSTASTLAVHTNQETIEGNCGGNATGSFNLDDVTGEFWGDLHFTSYCVSNVTLNGTTNFSGTVHPSTSQVESMSFDFKYLTGGDASGSFVIDGTLFLVQKDAETGITMNLFFKEAERNDVFWLNDYHLSIVDDSSTMTLTISGKYYHPAHGYVTLSTQQNLIIDLNRMLPLSGVLLAIGKAGTAGGPTTAKLTCHPDGLFQTEADTDGDGTDEWDSGMLSWDEP